MQSESANRSNFPTRVPTATYRFQFHKGFPLAQVSDFEMILQINQTNSFLQKLIN